MAENTSPAQMVADVERMLAKGGTSSASLLAILDRVLAHFHCVVGTIHTLNPATGLLTLCAQRGIPDKIMGEVQSIPIGKGMAGLAAQRLEPVQVCNLQTDQSGKAKPGARETRMEGCVSLPMLVDGQLRGTLGVAKPVAYDYSEAETSLLLQVAAAIGKHLA